MGLAAACALMFDGQRVAAVAVAVLVVGGIGLGALIMRRSADEPDDGRA